jgi:hypothetical protein
VNQGWICYAEKQLGSYVLPYVSSVKSPQQAIGAAIKHHLCQALGLRYGGTLESLVTFLKFWIQREHFMELGCMRCTM